MNILEKIDNYFYNKTQKDFWYIVIIILFLIGFLFFYFIYPTAQQYNAKQKDEYSKYTLKLQDLKNKIIVFNGRISFLNKAVKEENLKLDVLRKKDIFYTQLANLLDFAEFDQYKWANMVKNMVTEAKNEGLSVIEVSNKVYDNVNIKNNKKKESVIKRMDISITLKGSYGAYKNFIKYVYDYENRKDLIRVTGLQIVSPVESVYFKKGDNVKSTSKNKNGKKNNSMGIVSNGSYYVTFSVYGYNK